MTSPGQTEGLIREISRDLRPVRRIPRLRQSLAAVAFLWVTTGAAFLVFGGVTSSQLAMLLASRIVQLLLVGLVLVSAGGLLGALADSVPGRDAASAWGFGLISVGLIVIGGLGVALLIGTDRHPAVPFSGHLRCGAVALIAGSPLVVAVALFVVRGYPRRPGLVALAAGAGVVALGGITARISCPALGSWHMALGHALVPWLGMLLLGIPLLRAARRTRSDRV